MRSARFAAVIGITVAAFGTLSLNSPGTAHALGPLTMATASALPTVGGGTADGGTEPRETVVSTGAHPGYYVISNVSSTATVWESNDGGKTDPWHITGAIANQTQPSIDVDIASMPAGSAHPGRLIAVELDFAVISFDISYSDDGGVNWTVSGTAPFNLNALPGGHLADQDRPWLATGPGDRAYLLFHNLASGTVTHNMYVETSTDDGANFAAPTPVTTPGTQAFTDLQCADSGGPTNLFVNPRDGRVYAVFGTRSAQPAGGGCAASITGPFEVNVVAATRVWVATAPVGGTTDPTQWQQSLAVDDLLTGQIVGMQLAPGALDSADNLFILYPESVTTYPNYDGAAIKYVHATQTDIVANPFGALGPAHQIWSATVTVAASGGAGHLLPHIVAGGPGEIDFAYFEGDEIAGATPATSANWFLVAGQTLDALDANPAITTLRVSYPGSPVQPQAAYGKETASQMMGACGTGPAAGVENGTICGRSTDVWGIALDAAGGLQVTWPSASAGNFGCSSTVTAPPPCTTWVTTQTDGPTIAPPGPGQNVPEAPVAVALTVIGGGAAMLGLAWSRRSRRRTSIA